MADPFSLSIQSQGRLDKANSALESLPQSFMAGTKIPGIQDQIQLDRAKIRLAENEVKQSDLALSANEQLMTALQDPGGFARQFGELSSAADMRKFMARHAAIVVSPVGERMMEGFDRIATATERAEVNSIEKQLELATTKKQSEFLAQALDEGVDIKDPAALQAYRIGRNQEESIAKFHKLANAAQRDPGAISIGAEAFDDHGRISPSVMQSLINMAPQSQRLATQEAIATQRSTAQENIAKARLQAQKEGRGFAPSNTERKILEAEQRGIHFTADEVDDIYRISTGLKPRAISAPTAGKFADAHLRSLRHQDELDGIDRTDKGRVDYLKALFEEVYSGQLGVQPKGGSTKAPGASKVMRWNDQTGEIEE